MTKCCICHSSIEPMTKIDSIDDLRTQRMRELQGIYGWDFSPEERDSINQFLTWGIGFDFLRTALLASNKKQEKRGLVHREAKWKYFCGIVWNRIRTLRKQGKIFIGGK